MIAINEIRQIAQKMQSSGLGNIEISGKDFSLRLRCTDEELYRCLPLPKEAAPVAIKAAKKGQFWATHPMQDKAPIAKGAWVEAGDCLGFLQFGDLYLPVRSPLAGEITRLAVASGETVGRGRGLFMLRPAPENRPIEEVKACDTLI